MPWNKSKSQSKARFGLLEFCNFALYSLSFSFFLLLFCFLPFCFSTKPNSKKKKKKQNPTSSPFLVTLRQIISFSLLFFLISLLFSNKTKFQKKKNPYVLVFWSISALCTPLPYFHPFLISLLFCFSTIPLRSLTNSLLFSFHFLRSLLLVSCRCLPSIVVDFSYFPIVFPNPRNPSNRDAMAEIVFAFAGKVSEYLVAPIGRQLGYLFCYRSHAEKLRNQVLTLRTARTDEQITVDEATRKGDEIRPSVREWLNRVDQITGEAEALMIDDQNMSCLNGWCPNLISRYQLGREAYKKAQVIVGIQKDRNFPDGISYSVPPRSATFKGYECFQSRDSTLNDIMDALRDDKTKMIGVCGMGGLGKTMLVKQVAQQAKQQNLFTIDIFIDVSWTRDSKKDEEGIAKIQQRTAEGLGFQFKGKDESTRADELKQTLQKKKEPEKENQPEKEKEQKKENILIILDDIWREITLERVGIPFKDDLTICKLVLVSRDENRLRKEMGAQKCFPIQPLQVEEDWHLLKNIAGDSVEGDQLRPIAIKVLAECGETQDFILFFSLILAQYIISIIFIIYTFNILLNNNLLFINLNKL